MNNLLSLHHEASLGAIIDNPGFPIDRAALAADLVRMRADRRPLARPVLILAGWHSPGLGVFGVESIVRPLTSGRGEDFLSVAYPWRWSIDGAARRVIDAISRRGWQGREVDVIGISMGGLVARAIAAGFVGDLPVRIARLFTLATPHRGAKLARTIRPDAAARDMRPDSEFLSRLDGAATNNGPEIQCYALLRDWWVGATSTAPPRMDPHWLDAPRGPVRIVSHFSINRDRRVLADIARRLRGEEPMSRQPSPPPID